MKITRDHWLFDEFKHAGIDYSDSKTASEYDAKHAEFRDFDAEAEAIADKLCITQHHVLAEFGCGTGCLTIPFASRCSLVIAIDVSRPMLDVLEEKITNQRISNIQTLHGGFLNYSLDAKPVDFIVANAALHHLPDFWKSVALRRMFDTLKPSGKLYLFDVAFAFNVTDYENHVNQWIDGMARVAGQEMASEAAIHVRDEFSTYDWILDALIEKVGFRIESKHEERPNCFSYVCGK